MKGPFIPPPFCWRVTGVEGDLSCPELSNVIHCRNCPVLAAAARELFTWPQPDGYAADWTHLIAQRPAPPAKSISLVVFRIGNEWIGIETRFFAEIAPFRTAHRVAHRVNTLLEGLVNIRGQLVLCVAVSRLLSIPVPHEESGSRRLAVLDDAGELWAFPVNQVEGVMSFEIDGVRHAPATLPPPLSAMTRGIFQAGDTSVTFVSGELLTRTLKESLG